MADFRVLKNTDKEYKCTSCGSKDVSIIREDPAGSNPRLKCSSCTFLFNGADSLAAVDAGAIKSSSSESLAAAGEPESEDISVAPTYSPTIRYEGPSFSLNDNSTIHVDRPAYVFLSRPRGTVEFCTKRDFKRTAVKWHDKSYDVYELKKVSLNVKVDVS